MISKQDFMNPPAQFRGKPFWSWNGKLEKEELIRQIHVMKEMGFGGFFMHSRTGLQTEYLGEEWFDLINACADEGEKLGLEVWLYDEDRWPSGIAGGMVTKDPEFRMKSIKLEIVDDPKRFKMDEQVIAVFSCRIEGVSVYDYQRLDHPNDIANLEGLKFLVFRVIDMSKHSFYNGFTYVDTLNPQATERFIEVTHEKYKQKCGDRIGRSIKGIFTDEPHRGTLMDVFGAGNDEDIWRTPWTGKLPEKFIEMYDYDLLDRLPEIFLKPSGNDFSQVKWHYVELLQQMFLDNFAKPIHKWCKENNLILTGHVLHEDSLTAQTAMNGSVMRYYEHMDYPGVDLLTEGNDVYWVAKQVSSVARQLGQKWLLSELYGCTGWQMNFESHKSIGDWQALFGINLRCHHLSWYTMEGEAKRDYPASILHQSTWWKEYKYVEDYFSRLGLFLSQGKPCCELLVLNPIESVWSQIHLGWAHMLAAKAEEIESLEAHYRTLFHWLVGAHIDFDYGDEELIGRLSSVTVDESGKTILKVGEACYTTVLLSGLKTIRSSTLRLMNQFAQSGGNVIVSGNPPVYMDAIESEFPVSLLMKSCHVAFEKFELTHAIRKIMTDCVSVRDSDGQEIEDIFCQIREDDDKKYLVFMNINKLKAYKDVLIETDFSGYVEEWDCCTGNQFILEPNYQKQVRWQVAFGPSEEKAYILSKHKDESLLPIPQYECVGEQALQGPYSYFLEEPNVCVLDRAAYRLDHGDWSAAQEILKVDQDIRKACNLPLRGGEMLQPWFSNISGYEVKAQLELEFEFYVEEHPEGLVELVIEKPERFEISINNQMIDNHLSSGWWIDKCFKRLPISNDFLVSGANRVQLKVAFSEDINLESLYLIGQFGVRLDGCKKSLISLPEKVSATDLTQQGLPFYSGKIQYVVPLELAVKEADKVFIQLNQFEGACAKIIAKNQADKILAWKPYEADISNYITEQKEVILEVVLTRRNTFGPLHQVPMKAKAYGPFSYVTEGENFSDQYVLYPSGLLEEPKIIVKQSVAQNPL